MTDISNDTATEREVLPPDLDNFWGGTGLRVFLSHLATHKKVATIVKAKLESKGMRCFVAHEDITPTALWQDEIEKRLFSMEVCVALMTKGFHDSLWTDQEIGFAMGRCVPVIAVRLGADPYGFIGKYQAVNPRIENTYNKKITYDFDMIWDVLLSLDVLAGKVTDSLVNTFIHAGSYESANTLIERLRKLNKLTPEQINKLEEGFKNNDQLCDAHQVKRFLPDFLKRMKEHQQ